MTSQKAGWPDNVIKLGHLTGHDSSTLSHQICSQSVACLQIFCIWKFMTLYEWAWPEDVIRLDDVISISFPKDHFLFIRLIDSD